MLMSKGLNIVTCCIAIFFASKRLTRVTANVLVYGFACNCVILINKKTVLRCFVLINHVTGYWIRHVVIMLTYD